ncbi:MAG: hypothetical protein ACLFR1_01450 [Spirochaetia bacterium]
MSFYEELAAKQNGITPQEIQCIDRSFKKNGKLESSAFGDYSAGLESLSKEADISIEREGERYFVVLVDHRSAVDFSVWINGDGSWDCPVQGYIEPPPEGDPEPLVEDFE